MAALADVDDAVMDLLLQPLERACSEGVARERPQGFGTVERLACPDEVARLNARQLLRIIDRGLQIAVV
jgi:hypothetical protein